MYNLHTSVRSSIGHMWSSPLSQSAGNVGLPFLLLTVILSLSLSHTSISSLLNTITPTSVLEMESG